MVVGIIAAQGESRKRFVRPHSARILGHCALVTVTFLVFLLAPFAVRAQEGTRYDVSAPDTLTRDETGAAIGALTMGMKFKIPEFHGLEPELGLDYHSNRRNGLVGIGWKLTGAPFIERASLGKGAPKGDTSDTYLLDGEELVPCADLGGTHCTKRQAFLRIIRDGALDKWYVWQKDGTKETYETRDLGAGANGTTTFRWRITSRVDTRGNTVTFNYWTPGGAYYLDSVSYNGVQIRFFRETRPDTFTYARGASVQAETERLKTVTVSVGGVLARAYKLTYTTTGTLNFSLLMKVEEYGTDASISGDGTVVGGTALRTVLGYGTQNWEGTTGPLTSSQLSGQFSGDGWRYHVADVNGDARTDVLLTFGSRDGLGASSYVALANANGSFSQFITSQLATNGIYETGSIEWDCRVGDVNADGKVDIVFLYSQSLGATKAYVSLSAGNGTFGSFTETTLATSGVFSTILSKHFWLSDVDGNGSADLVYADTGNGYAAWTTTRVWRSLSNGDGSFTSLVPGPIASHSGVTMNRAQMADANGDGKQDAIVTTADGDGGASVYTSFSNGDGTFAPFIRSRNAPFGMDYPTNWLHFANDVNGDGKADIIYVYSKVAVGLSRGDGSYEPFVSSLVLGPANCSSGWTCEMADMNGDGNMDLVFMRAPRTGQGLTVNVNLSKGDGYFQPFTTSTPLTSGSYNYGSVVRASDVNGDRAADVVVMEPKASATAMSAHTSLSYESGLTRLLASVTNPYGGAIHYGYLPSSSYPNTNLPFVLPVLSSITYDDGRGNSVNYSLGYSGGLWSAADRAFLGFAAVRVNDPRGNRTVTSYRRTFASLGKAEAIDRWDPSLAKRYDFSRFTITEVGGPAITSLITERSDSECNQTTTCRNHLLTFNYDVYGNLTQEIDHGDTSVAGDERTTVFGFYPNTSAYIVGLPAYRKSYEGTTPFGAPLTSTLNYYDLADSETLAPVVGNVTKSRAWLDTTGSYSDTSQAYDTFGNVTQIIDPRGSATTITYDPTYNVFPIRQCNALNQCEGHGWDTVLGLRTSITDANNALTQFGYDALGRPTIQKTPDNSVISTQYFFIGSASNQYVLTSLPDGSFNGLWTQTYFDGFGREWRSVREGVTANSQKVRIYSNQFMQVWKESLWHAVGQSARYTEFDYDGVGRPAKTTHPDGSYTTSSYGVDGSGPFALVTDELGRQNAFYKDVRGNAVIAAEKDGSSWYQTRYAFNLRDQLIRVTDAAQNTTTLTWDSLGRKTSISDMDMGNWSYQYDLGNLLLRRIDALGKATIFTYDSLGRIKTKASAAGTVTWNYDVQSVAGSAANGRLSSVVYPNGNESYGWDLLGRATSMRQCIKGLCLSLSQTFDSIGRMRTLTYPNGELVTYAYDAAGNMASVSGFVESMAWSTAGQLTSMRYSNSAVTTLAYDPIREWLRQATVTTQQGTPYSATYAYNTTGRVTSMTQSNAQGTSSLGFGYDDRHRLESVSGSQTQSLAYDAIGNLTYNSILGAYTYDPAHKHAVKTAGANNYSYDANGNMLSGAGGNVYRWDDQSRLIERSSSNKSNSPTNSLSYFGYGADEDRIFKISTSAAATGAEVETRYYFGKLVETTSDAGALGFEFAATQPLGLITQYYYAGPLLVAKKDIPASLGLDFIALDVGLDQNAEAASWYHSDRLGSIRVMTNAEGLALRTYDYQPYGYIQSSSGVAPNDRAFTGHLQDDDSGLIYMGGRYYNPTLSRFLSADSIVQDTFDPRFLNRYSYVANDPLNNVDPSGHTTLVGTPDSPFGLTLIPVFPGERSVPRRLADDVGFDGSLSGAAAGSGVVVTVPNLVPNSFMAGLAGERSVVDPQPSVAYQLGAKIGVVRDNWIGLVPLPGIGVAGIAVKGFFARAGFGGLSRAAEFGIHPYGQLRSSLNGTGLIAHHLYEKRFAGAMGQKPSQMLSVTVTKAEHQPFTNAWRAAIPWGQGTANATEQQVRDAARQIYANHPEILRALGP